MSGWLVVTRLGRTLVTEPQTWPNCMFCNRTPKFLWTFQLESLIGNVLESLAFFNRKIWVCCCAQPLVFSFPKVFQTQKSHPQTIPPPKKKLCQNDAISSRASSLVSVPCETPLLSFFSSLEQGQLSVYCQSYIWKSTSNCKPLHEFRYITVMPHDHMLFYLKTHVGPLLLSTK